MDADKARQVLEDLEAHGEAARAELAAAALPLLPNPMVCLECGAEADGADIDWCAPAIDYVRGRWSPCGHLIMPDTARVRLDTWTP